MVLVAMKSVVIACKTITEDIEAAETAIEYSDAERAALMNAKGQLSASLSGLMAVAKAHAAGTSWGSDALVSATNNLTSAVNELARSAGSQRADTPAKQAPSQSGAIPNPALVQEARQANVVAAPREIGHEPEERRSPSPLGPQLGTAPEGMADVPQTPSPAIEQDAQEPADARSNEIVELDELKVGRLFGSIRKGLLDLILCSASFISRSKRTRLSRLYSSFFMP